MYMNNKHAQRRRILRDIASPDQPLHIEDQRLRGDIFRRGGVDGGRDKARDEGEVHHVGKGAGHGCDTDVDAGEAEECY